MTGENVVFLHDETDLDIPVERVLEAGAEENLESGVLLGFTSEKAFYFASSTSDTAHILLLLELAKKQLLEMYEERTG